MKWKIIVPLLPNSICPLFILTKSHSQLSVTEDVKSGIYIYWLKSGIYILAPCPRTLFCRAVSSLISCFITDFWASELIHL